MTTRAANDTLLEGLGPLLDAAARPRPGESGPAEARRARALGILRSEGLPDRSWEAWRHSDPSFLWAARFMADPRAAFEIPSPPGGISWSGPRSSPGLDDPLSGAFPLEGRPVAALQSALADNALIIRVPKGTKGEGILRLVDPLPTAGSMTLPTLHLILEEGSSLRVELDHRGGAPGSLALPTVRARLFPGAELAWCERDDRGGPAARLSIFEAVLGPDARLAADLLTAGAAWVRHEVLVRLEGRGSRAVLRGLTLGRGEAHLDVHTFVDHAAPEATSEQLFKGVASGRSTLVYNGSVLVREGAKGTDARQTNRNLALTDEVTVFSEPRLEIYHDDVRCTHGSATGPLDEEGVFYLRSRGLEEAEARRIILGAFVAEVFPPETPLGEAAAAWMRESEVRS